ncbi:MAG TPA: putative quinol monooxygenase [Thermoanaerobaculia bacterium]|nr:putative quinol monooxygenase [Thermoanaerobaculia bacterium]
MAITVIARGRALPGKEQDMEKALVDNAIESRKEAACVDYQVIHSLDDPAVFGTVERWRSKEDLDRHMQTPHVQRLFAALGPVLAEPPQIGAFEEVG